MSGRIKEKSLIILVLLLAFTLRLVSIDKIPPGLSHDEANNGMAAIQVLAGHHPIFFEINKGIEPLVIYLEAIFFYLFGISPVSLRLVNVFSGLLTVALTFPLTARLFNRRVALLAMTGVAVSFWAVFVSRLTLRAVLLPPLLLLTLYLLWRGLTQPGQNRRRLDLLFFGCSGLTAGAAMYTYLSARVVLPLLVVFLAYLYGRGWLERRQWLGGVALGLVWATVFAPLAFHYWTNADNFSRRTEQVSTLPYLLNGDIGPTLENTRLTLGMFTFYGDETDRYNLNGRPIFDGVNGLIFYLGCGLILGRLGGKRSQAIPATLLLLWFFFLLLPDFITDDSPHFLRTIGALPAVYLVWAVGVDRIAHYGEQVGRRFHKKWDLPAHLIGPIVVILIVGLATFHTVYDYFYRWATASGARYIYGADIAELAGYLKRTPEGELPVISAEYYRDYDPFRLTLHFQGEPPFVIWFDGRQTLAFPPPESGLSPRYLFANSAPIHPLWQSFLQRSEAGSGQAYTLYHLADSSTLAQAWAQNFPSQNQLNFNVNNELLLVSYRVLGSVARGGKFQVLLGWQALRTLPPDTDYTFLVRLRDEDGQIWAEADGNGYRPGDWQPGVRGLQLLTVRLPADLPPDTFTLTVEIIDRRLKQALPTTTGDSVITLETLTAPLAGEAK